MTYPDPHHGVLGAKRATWRTANPRELLRKLMDEHPKADENELRKLFLAEVEDETRSMLAEDIDREASYFFAIVGYWLDNNLRSLLSRLPSPPPGHVKRMADASAATARSEAVKGTLEKRIHEKAQILLLQLSMPNGKTLADCTGQECTKFGGWYARIAKIVPAKKLVGETVTESELRKLWRQK